VRESKDLSGCGPSVSVTSNSEGWSPPRRGNRALNAEVVGSIPTQPAGPLWSETAPHGASVKGYDASVATRSCRTLVENPMARFAAFSAQRPGVRFASPVFAGP